MLTTVGCRGVPPRAKWDKQRHHCVSRPLEQLSRAHSSIISTCVRPKATFSRLGAALKITAESLASLLESLRSRPGVAAVDEAELQQDIRQFCKALSQAFSLNFEDNVVYVQDSAHLAEIGIPSQLLSARAGTRSQIRVSRYFRLYVITAARNLLENTERLIEETASGQRFMYVPESLFGEPFDKRERFNHDAFNELFDFE